MELTGRDITIIGAGIGGLTAALALRAQGAEVRILEQAEAIREVGAGIQVSPNGLRGIEALGLGEQDRIDTRIEQSVPRVLARQSTGGGFGLWYPDI